MGRIFRLRLVLKCMLVEQYLLSTGAGAGADAGRQIQNGKEK